MSEMVERLARAMVSAYCEHAVASSGNFEITSADLYAARCAIEAMRKPTDRMRLAGSFAQDTPWSIYDAMIDAALADDQAKAL